VRAPDSAKPPSPGGAPRVAGIVHHYKRAGELARQTAQRLEEMGLEVRVPSKDAEAGRLERYAREPGKFAAGMEFAVSLGGDGTMLRTVDLVGGEGVPVLGVNVGHMGYLNELEPADLDRALERVLAGDYIVSERMLLSVVVDSAGPAGGAWWALNEAVLEKVHSGHLVRLAVSINRRFFTTYAADGVIVATPTGSTAYSFSARGPIVSPNHHCLLLTPVSPHMLFDRALVLGPDEELRFEVQGPQPVGLILDGRQVGELGEGDSVVCTQGPQPARLITFRPRDFHQILKAKFGLADR
jgi:NAD+ kinase